MSSSSGKVGNVKMDWLLPVGTPGGINSGFDGMPDGSGFVRLGDKFLNLDANPYRLWHASLAAPQLEELTDWAVTVGINDAETIVRRLEAANLLIEGGREAETCIGRLAIRVTGECIGNGPDKGETFVILGRNGIQLKVNLYVFEVILRSNGACPVSVICDSLDKARTELGHPPSIELLSRDLPMLVRNGVVRLDAAVR